MCSRAALASRLNVKLKAGHQPPTNRRTSCGEYLTSCSTVRTTVNPMNGRHLRKELFKINSFAGSCALKTSTGKQGSRLCIPFLNLESLYIELKTPTAVAKGPQNLLPRRFPVGLDCFHCFGCFDNRSTLPDHFLPSPEIMLLNGKFCL